MKCALLCDLDDPTTDAQIKKRDAIVEVLDRFASGELAAAGSGPAQPAGAAVTSVPNAASQRNRQLGQKRRRPGKEPGDGVQEPPPPRQRPRHGVLDGNASDASAAEMPFGGAHDGDDGGGDDGGGGDGSDDGGDNRGSGGGRVMFRILQGESLRADAAQSPDPVQVMRDRIEALKQEKERLQKVGCLSFLYPVLITGKTDSPSFSLARRSAGSLPTALPTHRHNM